ncbi:hypothetical protein B4134_2761 [Bacillus safensis]|nr:hypothetical protein B4134_2761 [Bacillus safensis]
MPFLSTGERLFLLNFPGNERCVQVEPKELFLVKEESVS